MSCITLLRLLYTGLHHDLAFPLNFQIANAYIILQADVSVHLVLLKQKYLPSFSSSLLSLVELMSLLYMTSTYELLTPGTTPNVAGTARATKLRSLLRGFAIV